MIYFAVATLYFYRDEIRPCRIGQNWQAVNKAVVKRVFDECIKYMNYELSVHQMDRAIAAYQSRPVTLAETLPA